MLWDAAWDQNNIINGEMYSYYVDAILDGSSPTAPPTTPGEATTAPETPSTSSEITTPVLTPTTASGKEERRSLSISYKPASLYLSSIRFSNRMRYPSSVTALGVGL